MSDYYEDPEYDGYDDEFEEEDGEYMPEFTPLWERLLGPGAIAASVVAIILAICALIITYVDPPTEVISYVAPDRKEEPEPEEEPEMEIEEQPVEIPVETEDNIVVKDVQVSDHNETADNEDFAEAKGDPENAAQVDFDNKSVLDTLGGGGGGGGRKGDRRGGRMNLVKGYGGSRKTESAVMSALRWLKRHQDKNGKWSLEGYTENCGREGFKGKCAGTGEHKFDDGATGLALLAYTGRGLDHKIAGEFKSTITNAMKYLRGVQKSDGCFGEPKGEHMYNQTLATFALADLLVMSDDDALRGPVTKGINYIIAAQNPPSKGGAWRYNDYNKYPEAADELADGILNDSSITTWVVMALKTAKGTGIKVDPKGFAGASKFLDTCYKEEKAETGYGKIGTFAYNITKDGKRAFAHRRPYATTACGILSRQFMNEKAGVAPGCEKLREALPVWDGTEHKDARDLYYWYYGSLAMFQMGGEYWEEWNEAMKKALTKNINNKRSVCLFGSWDPEETVWGEEYGGRVYTTAIGALTLEVYYRYSPMGAEADKNKK